MDESMWSSWQFWVGVAAVVGLWRLGSALHRWTEVFASHSQDYYALAKRYVSYHPVEQAARAKVFSDAAAEVMRVANGRTNLTLSEAEELAKKFEAQAREGEPQP